MPYLKPTAAALALAATAAMGVSPNDNRSKAQSTQCGALEILADGKLPGHIN